MSVFPDRRATISRLLNFEEYPEKLGRELEDIRKGRGLDPPVVLLRRHAYQRLNDFVLDEIPFDTLSNWAKLIYWQPDIDIEEESEDLGNLIFRLAHPDIHVPFDAAAALDWMERLKQVEGKVSGP